MRRFYVETEFGREAPEPGDLVTLDAEESHHLLHVLRGEPGTEIGLTDGRGRELRGRLVEAAKHAARVEILAAGDAVAEMQPPRLVLACAVVKGKRFEFALEKAVELGAHRLVPLRCERGVIDPRDGKLERWRGLLVSALKQSGRCWLPELAPLASVGAVLAAAQGPCYWGAAPAEAAAERPLGAVDAAARITRRREAGEPPPTSLTLLIGPEGGWSDAELALLRQAATAALDLGPHTLRTETAALAGLVVLQTLRQAWQVIGTGS